MLTLRTIAAAIAGVALLAQSSLADSIRRNPLDYISLIDDPIINTATHRINAHSEFDLIFTLHDGKQRVRLALEPNHDLLHEKFAVTYLDQNGVVTETESIDRALHKVYRGQAFVQRGASKDWSSAGWARIMVHQDGKRPIFDGAFRIDGDNHNIQTGADYRGLKHDEDPILQDAADGEEVMVVWRDSDITSSSPRHSELKRDIYAQAPTCNVDDLSFNSRYYEGALESRSLFGRQSIDGGGAGTGSGNAGGNLANTIGSVDGCPTTRKVALVGIAVDCSYWQGFDSKSDIQKSVIGMVNKASEVYESTFKISLGIQNITIVEKGCPGTASTSIPWNVDCGTGVNLDDRLSLFSVWRGQFTDANAYWTLLTRCNTESAVGLAWPGQLCRQGANKNGGDGNSTVAATNVVVRTSTEWQIFAHETGHTFGAVHDCTKDTCPVSAKSPCCPLSSTDCDAKGQFIMNPSTGQDISKFSPCSIGNICSGLKAYVKGDCLTDNKNVKIITASQCGNGIVEEGEQCDCGSDQACKDNNCCDQATCKLRQGSDCDPTNEDCCTNQCKFASNGTVCRASTGQCDPAEQCSGTSAACPDDQHSNNGDSCGDGLQCASGQCTSRDHQCRVMVGSQFGTNNTKACQGSSCMLSCQAPESGAFECIIYNQNFLDGTNCGGGGHCSNGSCEGSSGWKEFIKWMNDHKNIVIPVGAVLAGLLLLCVFSCIYKSIRRRIRRRRAPKAAQMDSMSSWPSLQGGPGMPGGPPPPGWQTQQPRQWQPENQWRQQDQWEMTTANAPPPPPENVHTPHGNYPSPGAPNQVGQWGRTNSGTMRYA